MVSDRVPSKCTQLLRIGDGTECLSVRVWLNNKSILMHNIYRVDGEFDVSPLSDGEESMMVGDFNARHTSWCRAINAAASSLNDQLVQLDTHILINTPHVTTTVHDTVIDLSLVSNEMAANTCWSIYPSLVSDHLAVMLTIVNIRLPDSTPCLKRWLLELAHWDKHKDVLQDRSAEMEWHGDLEVNGQQLVAVVLQAAEIAIPKSTGAASNRPYWRNNYGNLLARRTYNVALKKYRRNPLPELHRDLQGHITVMLKYAYWSEMHLGTSGSQRSIQLLMSETCGDVLDQHQEKRHDLQLIRSPIWKQRDSVRSSQIDPVHRTYHCRFSSSWLIQLP